ncbi:MAG TPA: hypothetical protein VJ875_16745 [Pyrinomonadaceae bacterium]|nr:hypothetical protein [Pyrinomonadaceae bacterium]
MATTTLGWIDLEREVIGSARLTNNFLVYDSVRTLATQKALWRHLMEYSGTGAAAYFLQQAGTVLTDIERIMSSSS